MADSDALAVTLDLSPIEHILADFVRRGGDVQQVFPAAAGILVNAIEDEFETEGHGSWKASLRAILQGGKTLQDTGVLAGSITAEHGADWIEAGTNVPYGKYHVTGTQGRKEDSMRFQAVNKRGKFISHNQAHKTKKVMIRALNFSKGSGALPIRNFLDIDMDAALDEISDLFLGHLVGPG